MSSSSVRIMRTATRLVAELWRVWSTPPGSAELLKLTIDGHAGSFTVPTMCGVYPQQPPELYAGLAPAGGGQNLLLTVFAAKSRTSFDRGRREERLLRPL